MKRFRGGLVYKAHRTLNHSTLGSRVIRKKVEACPRPRPSARARPSATRWYTLNPTEREFLVDNLLVRIHLIIEMILGLGSSVEGLGLGARGSGSGVKGRGVPAPTPVGPGSPFRYPPVHFQPCTSHPTPCTLRPSPYTLHPLPYTLHPKPHTLNHNPKPGGECSAGAPRRDVHPLNLFFFIALE